MPTRAHADSVPTVTMMRNNDFLNYAYPESNLGDYLRPKVRETTIKVVVQIAYYNPTSDDLRFTRGHV